jgi:Flp pilus assembly protein TadG
MRLQMKPKKAPRTGVASVEFALLLPFLLLLFLISIDFGRIFYYSMTVSNCARNGALWQCDPYAQAESPYKTLNEAALADAFNINQPGSQPKVSYKTGTDGTNNDYVEVTATYKFQSVTAFPLIPSNFDLTRTVRMPVAPKNPQR